MAPRVSVGLPVYNGEDYLADSIESVLSQTYEDLELVISDNASTDSTPEICAEFASQDGRVKYFRSRMNLGAGPNNNAVFRLSSGELFKIHNHDDIAHPKFIELCVQTLDSNPAAVSAYPSTVDIDTDGNVIRTLPRRPAFAFSDPTTRMWEALRFGQEPMAIFGVMRADIVARTRLLSSVPSADRIWLAELLMYGPFLEVEEPLFLHREHPNRSVHSAGRGHQSMNWWDPSKVKVISFPYWRMFRELFSVINKGPLRGQERVRAYGLVARWATENKHHLKLFYDAAIPLRPVIDRVYKGPTSTRG